MPCQRSLPLRLTSALLGPSQYACGWLCLLGVSCLPLLVIIVYLVCQSPGSSAISTLPSYIFMSPHYLAQRLVAGHGDGASFCSRDLQQLTSSLCIVTCRLHIEKSTFRTGREGQRCAKLPDYYISRKNCSSP